MINKISVLIVYSGNSGRISPFISDQAQYLSKFGVTVDYYAIIGKGIWGYLKNIIRLRKIFKSKHYSLVHAHYGFSGLLCALSLCKPLVITFHGTDITNRKDRILSFLGMIFSQVNIFVSKELEGQIPLKYLLGESYVIPCGVDLNIFTPSNDLETKEYFKKRISNMILFSSSIDNKIKNYELAKEAILLLNDNTELIELASKSRKEVAELMNEVDLLLLTSFSEGSPQVIKEALSCNCPIVATNVGDIKWVIGNTKGCYITSFEPYEVANNIKKAIDYRKKQTYTNGRNRILELKLDNDNVVKNILNIYAKVIINKTK